MKPVKAWAVVASDGSLRWWNDYRAAIYSDKDGAAVSQQINPTNKLVRVEIRELRRKKSKKALGE